MKKENCAIDRRKFIGSAALLAAGIVTKDSHAMMPSEQAAWNAYKAAPDVKREGMLDSEPLLHSPAPDSMGIGIAVTGTVLGMAEVADNPEMKNARRYYPEGMPLPRLDDRVVLVRADGLKSGTKYWYRVGAAGLTHPVGYWTKQTIPEWSKVYSFTTPGDNAPSHFAVINDTHVKWEPFKKVTDKLAEIAPQVTIWNGDLPHSLTDRREDWVKIFYKPGSGEGFAASMPIQVNRGNHDFRGLASGKLGEIVLERSALERSVRDRELGWNYAYRQGDIALIGLDTAEDKPDAHPANGGFTCFERYRSAQTKWLADQFKRPEIASAPYIVAFVHIPIYDPDPNANPGTILEDYAMWQKQAADEWGPILTANCVQLVIAGHRHRFRHDPAGAGRSWEQIVGGGPILTGSDGKPERKRFPTVIEGRVVDGRLKVKVHDIVSGSLAGEYSYAPRKI
jgi:hypothetical protein